MFPSFAFLCLVKFFFQSHHKNINCKCLQIKNVSMKLIKKKIVHVSKKNKMTKERNLCTVPLWSHMHEHCTKSHLLVQQYKEILSFNLYQSSGMKSADMWAALNYHHLLIISHDMKILRLWQDHLCQILCLTPITSHIIINLLQSNAFPDEKSLSFQRKRECYKNLHLILAWCGFCQFPLIRFSTEMTPEIQPACFEN